MERKYFKIKRNSFCYSKEIPDDDFLNKFSSHIFKNNNHSYGRALSAVSKIEYKKIFGENKKEENESILFLQKPNRIREEFECKNIANLGKPMGLSILL